MRSNGLEGAVEVSKVKPRPATLGRPAVRTGKPGKIASGSMRLGTSAFGMPGIGNSTMGQGGNFYSPELSTDFLELPQSRDEERNYYRFFYKHDPFVGQAIDLQTDIPLSKIRLGKPEIPEFDLDYLNSPEGKEFLKGADKLAKQSQRFCKKWNRRIHLLKQLLDISHDLNLLGEVFVFIEDDNPEMPDDVRYNTVLAIDPEGGEPVEQKHEREDADERAYEWLRTHYKGWTAMRVLPPEQISMKSFPFTDERLIQLIIDSKTKDLVNQAMAGDPDSQRIMESLPEDVVNAVLEGVNIPLNTDPEAGSFVHYISRRKSQYEERGTSVLSRCIRTLVFMDKCRQANTSIASRHMTPMRIVWVEDGDAADVEELREQVDMALQDPDYSIITNYQVNWEEMGAEQRLLDLTSEYERADRMLYAGLGVTESLLSGESSYSGDRINLEVINTRFMLFRELMQEFVEEHLYAPMCRRMGYVVTDEWGDEIPLVPGLSFTRLALRDNADTFDSMLNLYQKGSLDIDVILELLNIDPETTREKLKRDLFTLQDATFNELLRSIYNDAAQKLNDNSNMIDLMAKKMGIDGLVYKKAQEEGDGRFGG